MDNPDSRMGNIYDSSTASSYYEVQGKDVEQEKNTPDTLLESLIPENLEGKTVLDLGAGNGRYSEILAKRGAERVIAMDLSQSMVEETLARKNQKDLENLEIVKGDIENLPIGGKKLDYIFARFALMYTDKLKETVKQLADSLNENGEMLFEVNAVTIADQEQSENIKESPVPLVLSLGKKSVNIKNFAHTLEEYRQAFEDAGLKITALEQFPAEDLSVDPTYQHANILHFDYVVFKVVKDDRE